MYGLSQALLVIFVKQSGHKSSPSQRKNNFDNFFYVKAGCMTDLVCRVNLIQPTVIREDEASVEEMPP